MRMKINTANFPEGISLWVSSKCVSKKTGNTTYWATIDEFEDGALLYLAHSVWDGLDTVNEDTVYGVLDSGNYEITEATDRETGEKLTAPETGEQIYQISKAKASKKFQLSR